MNLVASDLFFFLKKIVYMLYTLLFYCTKVKSPSKKIRNARSSAAPDDQLVCLIFDTTDQNVGMAILDLFCLFLVYTYILHLLITFFSSR